MCKHRWLWHSANMSESTARAMSWSCSWSTSLNDVITDFGGRRRNGSWSRSHIRSKSTLVHGFRRRGGTNARNQVHEQRRKL
jgi:hypothetical protein